MLKTILKTLTLTLLLQLNIYATDKYEQPPYDARLNQVTNAKDWFYTADKLNESAYNLGITYQEKFKDYKQAIFWFKQSYRLNNKDSQATHNIGYLYDELKQYNEAIKWYKKTDELGEAMGAYNLALLYKNNLHKTDKAIKWYKIAVQKGHWGGANNLAILYKNQHKYKEAQEMYETAIKHGNLDAVSNLAKLYRLILKDNVKSVQYYTVLIGKSAQKDKLLYYFKEKWNFTDKEIKKGYELQLNSKIIPEKLKYKGGI